LAVPLRFGQEMNVEISPSGGNRLLWQSYEHDRCWFTAEMEKDDFQITSTNDKQVAQTLQKILLETRKLNPAFLPGEEDTTVTLTADFNLQWGIGSSSSLISNIALWAKADPYILLQRTFGGSGYDIACAQSETALFYTLKEGKPLAQPCSWAPEYSRNLFFVYLGKKMNSRTGMSYFRENAKYTAEDIREISSIGEQWIAAENIEALEELIRRHEAIMSRILQLPTVQEERFPDYPYTIKSMGAWGGDFVLVTGRNEKEVREYFTAKGLETVFSFDGIIRT